MARPSVAILGLHDKTVVFRLSMQCKIEDVVLDGLAQVEIAIPGNEFVATMQLPPIKSQFSSRPALAAAATQVPFW